jgi:hypothetical protein
MDFIQWPARPISPKVRSRSRPFLPSRRCGRLLGAVEYVADALGDGDGHGGRKHAGARGGAGLIGAPLALDIGLLIR